MWEYFHYFEDKTLAKGKSLYKLYLQKKTLKETEFIFYEVMKIPEVLCLENFSVNKRGFLVENKELKWTPKC